MISAEQRERSERNREEAVAKRRRAEAPAVVPLEVSAFTAAPTEPNLMAEPTLMQEPNLMQEPKAPTPTTTTAELPPGWLAVVDPSSGNSYYVSPEGETSWTPPAAMPSQPAAAAPAGNPFG